MAWQHWLVGKMTGSQRKSTGLHKSPREISPATSIHQIRAAHSETGFAA